MQLTPISGGRPPSARILVIDDEESIRVLLLRLFTAAGYSVALAADADIALEMMRAAPADVALVDIRMPGHDGVWLIEKLQQRYPDTAIVVATGIHDLDPRITLSPGIAGYIVKPFDIDKMLDIVAHAVTLAHPASPKPQLRVVRAAGEIAEVADDDSLDSDS